MVASNTFTHTFILLPPLQYYPLDISFFKSSLDAHMLDLLWYKYWVATLSASPLISNREFAAGQVCVDGLRQKCKGV